MVFPATGDIRQDVPDVEQIVDGESQIGGRPLPKIIDVAEDEKRIKPFPAGPRPQLPAGDVISRQETIQRIYGLPVTSWNQLITAKQEWVELIRIDVPESYTGDLHEISLKSNDDSKTRWRIILANIDQNIPTDRTLASPLDMPWQRTLVPGGTSCWVAIQSSDGTQITVDGMMTMTIR